MNDLPCHLGSPGLTPKKTGAAIRISVIIESGLDISSIITHRLHYTDFHQGFDEMRAGKVGKLVWISVIYR